LLSEPSCGEPCARTGGTRTRASAAKVVFIAIH
jgi:hypothetical protein